MRSLFLLFALLLITSCAESDLGVKCPFIVRTVSGFLCPGSLEGRYEVTTVRCGTEESIAFPDALWTTDDYSIVANFDIFSGERITTFPSCRQTVPLESIVYSAPGMSRISEGSSECVDLAPGGCDPFVSVCGTPPFVSDIPYDFNGDVLTTTILDLGYQGDPCVGQPTPVKLIFKRVE